MVGDQHLVAAHDGGDGDAVRQFELLDAPPDHAAGLGVAVHHRFNRLGRAAAQAVHPRHVAAAHVREQRPDGGLRGRKGDVDLPRLQQVDVGAPVDQRHHAARAHALGEQG